MYRKNKPTETTFNRNEGSEGETIENKVERIVNNKEAITDNAPQIYTERKDGVLPGTDIRTDRFEIALEAMTKVEGARAAKREERMKAIKGGKDENKDSGAEPIHGENNK